jgi:hypothetical protein
MAQELGSYQLIIADRVKAAWVKCGVARHKMLARPRGHQARETRLRAGHLLALPLSSRGQCHRGAAVTAHGCTLYDFGTTQQDGSYYVMELLERYHLQTLVTDIRSAAQPRASWRFLRQTLPIAGGSASKEARAPRSSNHRM